MNIWPGCSKDDWYSIPSRSGDFFFSTAPTQTLGLIHHTVIVYDSMVLCLLSLICCRVWSLTKHKDKSTFTSCKNRWHYIPHLTVECKKKCHNKWIHTNIWKGNNHIISMTWCSCIKMFLPIKQHRIKKAQITPKGSNTSSKWHILKSASCSGWIQFVNFVTALCQQKAQSMIQPLALE